jgi:fatty-acyl-CoA synthase
MASSTSISLLSPGVTTNEGGSMEVALTPLEFSRRARVLYPDREAVIDGDRRFSYRQFFERCDRFSAVLQAWGIHHGDRVAYIAPNTHAHLEGYYAVPQIGAVIVPINYRLIADDFAYIINHSGARILCVHSDYCEAIDRVRQQLPLIEHFVALEGGGTDWWNYEALLAGSPGRVIAPGISESDLISINYTSGTTARPKGVMITHRNAYLNCVGTLIHQAMSPTDRYLWTLPMFHANGWTFVWTVTARGAAHVCLRRVDPRAIFELMTRERISIFCAAPTVLIGIANAPAEVRAGVSRGVQVLTAGAPPAAVTIERIEGELGWRLTHVYGLTETSPFITVCEELPEHRQLEPSQRATLKARQGVELVTSGEVRVIDEHGLQVPHDGQTTGEIVVRGNVVMSGYYNDPEATERALHGGWFHSGDAAVVHPDGYIEIRDRIKDVIVSGGENISSVEVEGVLLRHPAVQEVAVVGMPHEKWGEAPHAYVVLRPGETVTEPELQQFARDHLVPFKMPRWVSFIGELPKTATGKVQKYVLRGGRSAIARQ